MTSRPLSLAYLFAALSFACGGDSTAPQWPVMVQLRLVNETNDAVFIRAVGEESLYPGVAALAPRDSACTTLNAYADNVQVEVHSWTAPDVIYGSALIHPLASAGWHAVVETSGMTVVQSAACA